MGARAVPPPGAAVLFGAFVVLLAVASFGAADAAAPAVVVGSVKCLDCSPADINAEDAFKGLQVAIKCKSGTGETYETQALGHLDDTGAFSVPLAAGLLRDDGEMDRDCFAQLHSAPDTPCAGLAPPKIGPNTQGGATYLSVADGTVFSPVACMCKKKKKHFMMGPPPPPPQPRPQPSYGPPTPTPTPPTPTYGPPMPQPPPQDDPEPSHKHPKMKKMMHKKKPCPPEDAKPESKN